MLLLITKWNVKIILHGQVNEIERIDSSMDFSIRVGTQRSGFIAKIRVKYDER